MNSSQPKIPSSPLDDLPLGNMLLKIFAGVIVGVFSIMASYIAIISFIKKFGLEGILLIVVPVDVALLIVMALCIRWLWYKVLKLEADVRVLKSILPEPLRTSFDKSSHKIKKISKNNYKLYEKRLEKHFQQMAQNFSISSQTWRKRILKKIRSLFRKRKDF